LAGVFRGRVKLWEVKEVKFLDLGFVMSGGKKLSMGCTGHDRNLLHLTLEELQ
jgi:hypothetical protein